MPTFALLLSLFADLAGLHGHVERVHGYALPFAVDEREPHFLVEKEGWIVYIGLPLGADASFRMARSRDRGAHWKMSDFNWDWYPREVRVAGGRLDIHFDVVKDCFTGVARLEGAIGGRLRSVGD